MELIYKIATIALWEEAQAKGVFAGAPVDLADGYIHFSTRAQAEETAANPLSLLRLFFAPNNRRPIC